MLHQASKAQHSGRQSSHARSAAADLLGPRGQLDAGDAGLRVVRHHDGVVP